MKKTGRVVKILDILKREFPDARTALEYSTPLELLIATMLSAQATDKLVNRVTPGLFKKYRSVADFSVASVEEIEADISSINFFRNKARSISGCAKKLVSEFGGVVPGTMNDLVSLPGVGRKTANVVLGAAFGGAALAVDTHVKRVAGRLGLTTNTDPDKIEADLTALIPEDRWTSTTHLLILHGRKTCQARKPKCDACPVSSLCDYYKNR
jgi:endonuclease-3